MRPRATDVKPLSDYRLPVTFGNHEKKIFDVKPYLNNKPFDQLKNEALFNTVHIGGLSVERMFKQDICPEEL